MRFLQSPVAEAFDIVQVRSDLLDKSSRRGAGRAVYNVLNAAVLLAQFLRKLGGSGAGIVHIRTNSYAGFFEKSVLAAVGRLAGRKVIMHIHGGAFGEFYRSGGRARRWLIRKCLAVNHRVVALSQPMRQTLLEIGARPGQVAVIENAVFLPDRWLWDGRRPPRPAGNGPEALRVLFLNRISADKGVRELIEAMEQVVARRPGARCAIHGPASEEEPDLRRRIAERGLERHVELPGPLWDQAKEEAFLGADVYVLPSYVEGMPIGLLEAMSYGLPCISTPVGGIPSVIEDGRNGLLVPPRQAGALAEAILRLAGDPALRRRIGLAARRTIAERFCWEVAAPRVIELYRGLLAPAPHAAAAASSRGATGRD